MGAALSRRPPLSGKLSSLVRPGPLPGSTATQSALRGQRSEDEIVKQATIAIALGAALLLSGSVMTVHAMGGGGPWPYRSCPVDLKSLCTGILPGGGRIPACMMSHLSDLSVSCSTELSRAAYVAKECEADEKRYCGAVRSGGGRIEACMRPHLGAVSDACRGALAFIAACAVLVMAYAEHAREEAEG
jgi:hypothetical protein